MYAFTIIPESPKSININGIVGINNENANSAKTPAVSNNPDTVSKFKKFSIPPSTGIAAVEGNDFTSPGNIYPEIYLAINIA